jgi:TolA-binding protein
MTTKDKSVILEVLEKAGVPKKNFKIYPLCTKLLRLHILHSRLFWGILSFVCLLALAFYPLSSFAEPVITIDADRQFEFAGHYFDAGEYYRAIGEYKRFIYFFPEDTRHEQAMYKIGMCYLNGQKFQEAINTLKNLLTQFPSTDFKTKARFRISQCFAELKEYLRAIDSLDRIAATAKDTDISDKAYYRRGWIYLEMDQWEAAEKSFACISSKNREQYRLETLSHEMRQKKELKTKNPTTSGILAIIPGAGHLYCGRYRDAAMAFLFNSAMIYAAYEAFDHNHDVLGGIITFFEVGLYSGNIYSAVNCAHKYNRDVKNRFLDYLRENSQIKLGLQRHQNKRPALMVSCQIAF